MDGMTSDGFVDYACLFAHDSSNQGEVNFCHGSRRKLAGKIAMGRVVLRDDESAAGFLIQTMNNSWAFLSPDAGKIVAVRQERINQRVLLMTGARMHHDAGRLVQDEEIVVFENHFERYLLWLRIDLLDLRLSQLHKIAGASEVPRSG
jgi:hypothetical protein